MIKNKLLLLLILTSFIFTGCFETTEDLTINENGSGVYKLDMDFTGLFDMMDAMKAADTTGNATSGFPKERRDTTLYLRRFTDTAASLTAEQKALYQNVSMRLLMDAAAKEFKAGINMPFQKIGDVEKLMKLVSSQKESGVLRKLFMQGQPMSHEESDGNVNLPDMNGYYDMTITKGVVARSLNKAKYDSLMQSFSGELSSAQMEDMLAGVKLNTLIHLPHAAKKITGAAVVASDDKKTIRLTGSMSALFKNPQAFSYRIEY